ncbi:MAG: xanthine dehydrogenase family protein subunit M [Tissierellales bacterium]|nr:xanthine dehydrogenase family protein subunit M [Tissierellales bacterium]
MRSYFYESPSSFEELFQISKTTSNEIKFLAGGTDFVPKLNLELNDIPKEGQKDLTIVSLSKLDLNKISESDEEIKIGSMVTFTELKKNNIVNKYFPVFEETIKELAGLSVRNVATIGGNIMNASPAADIIPTLIALDAVFILKSSDGEREINSKDFFEGPGNTVAKKQEILKEVIIKKQKGTSSFKKLGRRKAETLSVVNAAAYIEKENNICKKARITIGSVAPTVLRCKEVEEALIGKELTDETMKEASLKVLDSISPIDDIRATAWYRKKVSPVMIRRAIESACDAE